MALLEKLPPSKKASVEFLKPHFHPLKVFLVILLYENVLIAAQSFLRRLVHPREPCLLRRRLVVSDHLCQTLGGEEDYRDVVSDESC